jgi:hypothetical protein
VWVDGTLFGTAVYGLARPPVSAQFPGYPDTAFPAWAFTFDSRLIANDEHHMQVIVVDDDARTTMIAERFFTVDNP